MQTVRDANNEQGSKSLDYLTFTSWTNSGVRMIIKAIVLRPTSSGESRTNLSHTLSLSNRKGGSVVDQVRLCQSLVRNLSCVCINRFDVGSLARYVRRPFQLISSPMCLRSHAHH